MEGRGDSFTVNNKETESKSYFSTIPCRPHFNPNEKKLTVVQAKLPRGTTQGHLMTECDLLRLLWLLVPPSPPLIQGWYRHLQSYASSTGVRVPLHMGRYYFSTEIMDRKQKELRRDPGLAIHPSTHQLPNS